MENMPTEFRASMENIMLNSKLCIVCFTESPDDYTLEYQVYIIDLPWGGDEEFVPVPVQLPTVRLDWECFVEPAICVLGRTLYLIEGCHPKDNPDSKKSVFTYDISDAIDLKLDRSMLEEAVGMNGPKISPKATVTPDGQILMFSSLIILYPSPNEFDFELYEPERGIWHKLPALPEDHRELDHFRIESFTFMSKDVFLIRTEIGIFTLNLKLRNKIWKRSAFQGDECIPSFRGDSFLVIGRDICVIPYYAFDIRVRGTRPPIFGMRENVFATLQYAFPELFSFSSGYSYQSPGVILLDHQVEGKNFTVCFLHAGINDDTKRIEMILQIYYCDLAICKKQLSADRKKKVKESSIWWERKRETFLLPGTSEINSFKVVASASSSQVFDVLSFSSVRSI